MSSYQDALRSRLNTIDTMGESQTTWERLKAARERSRLRQGQDLEWQQSINNRMDMASQHADGLRLSGTNGTAGGDGFDAFINRIATKESGNNYNARNRDSGAMGKYQIMPSNLGGQGSGWDYEALGRDVSASQFMASPQIQEAIARYKLNEYYNRYGAAGASIAWYAGPNAANQYQQTGYVSNAAQGAYPSIASYMNSIAGR